MLILNFTNAKELLLKALHELQNNLQFQIERTGTPVELEHIEAGLIVSGTGQGYKLQYSTLNTLFRGVLLILANQSEKEFRIEQTCCFEDFGIMIDLSRNAVLKVNTLKDMIRHLAVLGYKSIQLYTEDTMEVEQEEYFGYMRGALTGDEIKELDLYCQLFGIELIPCIQCLAHLKQIVRYERYDGITDIDDILLVGEERTYELLEHILKTASDNFTSNKINIGMDEAHMIGLGKYLDKNGYQNRFEIMLKHLDRVNTLCKKYSFEPQMWSDMFFRLVYDGQYYDKDADPMAKELFDKIPKDVKLIYWDYYSCDYQRYKNNLKIHLSISDQVGFAGGAWKWIGFAPDNEYSIRTGECSMRACKDMNIKSFLLTCWGDNGAEASIYSILPSIYYYAEQAYTDEFHKVNFKFLTGIDFDDYMLTDLPNRFLSNKEEHNNACKFYLYNDILMGTFDSVVPTHIDKIYEKHANVLKNIEEKAGKYQFVFETLRILCEVLSVKANLGIELKNAYDTKDMIMLTKMVEETLPKLIHLLKEFYQSFYRQWHIENKSFGFEVQCIRLGGLIQRVEYVMNQLQKYLMSEIYVIEELEIERKPFAYFDNKEPEKLIYNLWNVIATPSVT